MDPDRREVDYATAVALTGPAGSITIHHARTVHGSATNTSGKPRRLLLHQYRAADAWPLMAFQQDFDDFRASCCAGGYDRAAHGGRAGAAAAAAGRAPGLDL